MLMPELKEVDKTGRLSILNRRTIKMDYEDHPNKKEHDIFEVNSRINPKNIDKQEVEKNVEEKLRKTSPYFFGQRNEGFYPNHLLSNFKIGAEKNTGLAASVNFEKNNDKITNRKADFLAKLTGSETTNSTDNQSKNRNKSELTRTASNMENDNKKSVNLYNEYSKQINDKVKAREAKTKLVSRSFIDERENKKEFLRQSIEKESNFIHKENRDYVREHAKNREILNEKFQQKMKTELKRERSKVEDYYNKYVENFSNKEEHLNSSELKKGRIIYYQEELNNQIEMKKQLKEKNIVQEERLTPADLLQKEDENKNANDKKDQVDLHSDKKSRTSRKSEDGKVQELSSKREASNKITENQLKDELNAHLKKNKHQKEYFDSMTKQIEEKNKSKVLNTKSSGAGTKRSVASVEVEEEIRPPSKKNN